MRTMGTVIAVKAIILNAQKEVLLLRRNDVDSIDGGMWDIPGGRAEDDENLENALRREVEEETSLHVEISSLHSNWTYQLNNGERLQGYTFLYAIIGEYAVNLSHEHSEYRWVKLSNIDAYNMHENLKREIKLVV